MEHWANNNHGPGHRRAKGDIRAPRWQDGRESMRSCLGIIVCSNAKCVNIVRPMTKGKSREEKQAEQPSQSQAARKQRQGKAMPDSSLTLFCNVCGTPNMRRVPCKARARIFKFAGGWHYVHEGTHNHARPPRTVHLTRAEEAELEELVENHPNLGPLRLQVRVRPLLNANQADSELPASTGVRANPSWEWKSGARDQSYAVQQRQTAGGGV